MANINYTSLSCTEMAGLENIMTEKWEKKLTEWYEVSYSCDTPVIITSYYKTPEKEIAQMSGETPELLYFAEFYSDPEESPVIRVVEFRNGVSNEVSQRPNYQVSHYPPQAYIGNPFNDLMERAKEIFRRLDTVVGARGTSEVDIITCPIVVTVENSEYQLKVMKQGFKVEVAECLKRRPGTPGKWKDIEKDLKGGISL